MANKDILNTFKNALHSKEGSFDKRTMHPVRDWFIGLFIFVSILVLGGIQSALVFVDYRNIEIGAGNAETSDGVSYNGSLVHLALEAYRAKALQYKLPETITLPQTPEVSPVVATSTATSSVPTEEPEDEDETSPRTDVILQ